MSPEPAQEEPRKTRRTANACVACRQSKIKCSGEVPCSNCQRRFTRCHFTESGNKVVVSERLLQELREQARAHRPSRSPSRRADDQSQSGGGSRTPGSHEGTQSRGPRQQSSPNDCQGGSRRERDQSRPRDSMNINSRRSQNQAGPEYPPLRGPASAPGPSSGNIRDSILSDSPDRAAPHAHRRASSSLYSSSGLKRRRHAPEAYEPDVDDDDDYTTAGTPPLVRGRIHPERHLQETPKPQQEELPPLRPLVSALNSTELTSRRFTLPSRIIKNEHPSGQGWIWLAPWSTWSFTVRLRLLMKEKLYPAMTEDAVEVYDGKIYPLRWKPSTDDAPDISGLPSIDYALYLFNAVKFHLGRAYRFFEDVTFLNRIHEFYEGDAQAIATEHRFWFVQYLLVLAFGKAFVSRSRASKDPPGAFYFVRAMSLMPDPAIFRRDSILAIEVTALAGLYFYAIDHRESAHVYLGHSIRIAQLEGLHTPLPEQELGAQTVKRCRNLWWTLYIMDRQFSTSLGLPMTMQDSGISTPLSLPGENSQEDTALVLQVKLSQLLSHILSSIYQTDQTQLGPFLEVTGTILRTLAGHAQDIEKVIDHKFKNSVDTMPKGIRHISLLYHQCVMVATRPLLLFVLQERLNTSGRGDTNWEPFLATTTSLISTGIKSAVKTLQILTDEDYLLEVFLVFDLEFVYSAAIHLTMADALFPSVAEDARGHSQAAHSIIDDMVSKGNKVAVVRKADLTQLEDLCRELAAQSDARGLQTLTLLGLDDSISGSSQAGTNLDAGLGGGGGGGGGGDDAGLNGSGGAGADAMAEESQMLWASLPPPTTNLEFLDNMGISSEEVFSILDQIGNMDNYGGMMYHWPDAE